MHGKHLASLLAFPKQSCYLSSSSFGCKIEPTYQLRMSPYLFFPTSACNCILSQLSLEQKPSLRVPFEAFHSKETVIHIYLLKKPSDNFHTDVRLCCIAVCPLFFQSCFTIKAYWQGLQSSWHSYQVRGTRIIWYGVRHFLCYYYKSFFKVNPTCNTRYGEFGTWYVGLMREPVDYGSWNILSSMWILGRNLFPPSCSTLTALSDKVRSLSRRQHNPVTKPYISKGAPPSSGGFLGNGVYLFVEKIIFSKAVIVKISILGLF